MLKDGTPVIGGVVSVSFALAPNPVNPGVVDPLADKWVAVLTVDAEGVLNGGVPSPLTDGNYTIRGARPAARRRWQSAVSYGPAPNGAAFQATFNVVSSQSSEAGQHDGARCASHAAIEPAKCRIRSGLCFGLSCGRAMVWEIRAGVFFQMYDDLGNKIGTEQLANTDTSGINNSPAVAMDGVGDFVITWSHETTSGANTGEWGRIRAVLQFAR